ncbi:hypothetical protein AB1Y20_021885 [Prymnesium parvum]|uniref:Uncharacterized protein n=1 Tax=Prymnesium parvum TaxID=97485 RepID=A0AB34JFM6_PRYPA
MAATPVERLEALYQRLAASVPPSERARFARALAALEAHHRHHLHTAQSLAAAAGRALAAAHSEAAVNSHAAGAREAKLGCALEELRCELTRRESQLEHAVGLAALEAERRASEEHTAKTTRRVLAAELRAVETLHAEASTLLRHVHNDARHRGEHLGAVKQQSERSTELLLKLQEQVLMLQKKLAAQQRRTARLQELQQTADAAARGWSIERTRLGQAVAHATERARVAEDRCVALENEHLALATEAAQERKASADAIRDAQSSHRAQTDKLQSQLNELSALVGYLKADQSKVMLGSGGGSTIAEFTHALQQRLQRRSTARP